MFPLLTFESAFVRRELLLSSLTSCESASLNFGASLCGPPCVNGFHGHIGEMRADSVLVSLGLRFFAAHSFSPSGGYDS